MNKLAVTLSDQNMEFLNLLMEETGYSMSEVLRTVVDYKKEHYFKNRERYQNRREERIEEERARREDPEYKEKHRAYQEGRNAFLKKEYNGLYGVWNGLRARCNNPNNKDYMRYGGRGIEVCKDWDFFHKFYDWAKDKHEKGLEIDRIDVNGNYCPKNCRFVTRTVNLRNRRNTKLSEEDVAIIKRLINDGHTQRSLAERFKVHYNHINNIKTGRFWKDIQPYQGDIK